MLALLAAAALAAPAPDAFVALDAPGARAGRARLVFIGDVGMVAGDGPACDWGPDGAARTDCVIQPEERGRLQAAIRAEQADAIYALGDLVYPMAPRCRAPRGRRQARLHATLGAALTHLGAPAWLALGNHDVGHLGTRPGRLRCLQAYADAQPDLRLPAPQYAVDHGPVTVVVLNSNLRDPGRLPAEAVREARARGDQVVVAAHHELRTAWEKEREGPHEPPPAGAWLVEEGLRPDLWANGHAHTLQLGAFDARTADRRPRPPGPPHPVLALTSGAGSKLRANPTCDPAAPPSPCDAGHPRGLPVFALARFGYAVVEVEAAGLTVALKDLDGVERFRWVQPRGTVGAPWSPPTSPESP